MASKKLYMESIDACYLKDFTAEVTAVDENSVTLDQTLFTHLAEAKIGIQERLSGTGETLCDRSKRPS